MNPLRWCTSAYILTDMKTTTTAPAAKKIKTACPVCGKLAAARHYRMVPFVTVLGARAMRAEWCRP